MFTVMDGALLYCKAKVNNFFKRLVSEQAGGAELIATLVIIGIVLILAFAFKDKLIALVKNIWNKMIVDGTENITQNQVGTTWN